MLRLTLLVTLALLPTVALADVNQTTTLTANTNLNLDTGATSASGGDLLWNGSTITPQGNARAFNVGPLGAGGFESFVQAQIPPLLVVASAAPIPASVLVPDDFFVVRTNGGNPAKVLVTAKSGTSITLRFTTFIAAAPTGPAISAIQNNSSRIPAGFPNYGIAPSSLFVVVGRGLADAGEPVLQSSQAPGLPLTLNGASLTVVVNGVTTRPPIWYTSPTQIAAVLPAATPVGTGTLTVNYGGASVSTPIRVVAAALGINSYSGNLGVATDAATGALLTFTNSGSPGQNIVLWTSGLGADPADSDTTFANPPHPVATPLQIYIGGVQATILYQGSAGYPGVNQINVTIPQSVPTGCGVSLVAVANGVLSNTVMIPIKSGGGVCVDALTGATGTQFSQGEAKAGLVSIVQTNRPREGELNAANAAFGKYSGLDAARTGAVPSPGGCVVTQAVLGTPAPSFTGLDPGLITLSGPNGLNVSLAAPFGIKGAYLAALPAGSIPKTGGTFTFKGAGGTDVGSFTSTVEFANPLLTWTNQAEAAMVDRSQGLTVTWTGGNPGSYVVISGTAGANSIVAGFTCLAPVDAGRFTVPSYILLAIPSGPGATELQNYAYSSLSASGIDAGLALGDISIAVTSTYR